MIVIIWKDENYNNATKLVLIYGINGFGNNV